MTTVSSLCKRSNYIINRSLPYLTSILIKQKHHNLFFSSTTNCQKINGNDINGQIDSDLISLTVNGRKISAPKGNSILEACRLNDIYIPSLCWHPDLCVGGNCRICLVEYARSENDDYDTKLKHACGVLISDGISIRTNSQKVKDNVRAQLKFMRLSHSGQCLTCTANGKCELQDLCFRYNVNDDIMDSLYDKHIKSKYKRLYGDDINMDNSVSPISSNVITMEPDKCVLCQRCVRTCNELQGMSVLGNKLRGGSLKISTFGDISLD
eukprot:233942_1